MVRLNRRRFLGLFGGGALATIAGVSFFKDEVDDYVEQHQLLKTMEAGEQALSSVPDDKHRRQLLASYRELLSLKDASPTSMQQQGWQSFQHHQGDILRLLDTLREEQTIDSQTLQSVKQGMDATKQLIEHRMVTTGH